LTLLQYEGLIKRVQQAQDDTAANSFRQVRG
jgi:hypothetical protein